jgi:hypothetical protein
MKIHITSENFTNRANIIIESLTAVIRAQFIEAYQSPDYAGMESVAAGLRFSLDMFKHNCSIVHSTFMGKSLAPGVYFLAFLKTPHSHKDLAARLWEHLWRGQFIDRAGLVLQVRQWLMDSRSCIRFVNYLLLM